MDNINIHMYGPHIFHTSNEEVWKWINQFTEFNNFTYSPVAHYKGEIYSLPFNMWTFSKLFNKIYPIEVIKIIENESKEIDVPTNLEEQSIKLVGRTVYEKLIKGYTTKQWMKDPKELPKEIIKRLPVRFTYDNNYFNDKYQGIPIGGYTQIFEKLLNGIDVKLNTDFFTDEVPQHDRIIYTGPIDKFFNYKHGKLEYKTLDFKHHRMNNENCQGVAVMNETDIDVKHTRTIEHKHFDNSISDVSWVTWEYPVPYVPENTEPYYPINDELNNKVYDTYKNESRKLEPNVFFGGRLGEYKYYDMDKVIESALNFIKKVS